MRELWRMFDQVDPASRMSLGRRRGLVEALHELTAAEVIRLPSARSYDRTEQPAAPEFVTVIRPEPASVPDADIIWHSELAWAAGSMLTVTQREQLAKVNEWLFRRRDELVIPVRERSLEIFGDEKALDAMLLTRAFDDGRLSLDMLQARRVVPRLYTEPIGPGSVLLVVENSDTFDSLTHALADSPGRVGFVAWGAGAGFEASVLSVPRRTPEVTEIRYFGDLDRAGLRIPASADRLAQTAGMPPVRPAVELYDALLTQGVHQIGQQPVPDDVVAELTSWADPQHRAAISELLRTGHRMAQEAVGLAYLLSADGWRPP